MQLKGLFLLLQSSKSKAREEVEIIYVFITHLYAISADSIRNERYNVNYRQANTEKMKSMKILKISSWGILHTL